uniref:Solute carrier family 25 member 51 n=1 Tax=Heterorhabditis bacteriophora TaxID=37862 RepID=A0A1I7WAQ4_HETBA
MFFPQSLETAACTDRWLIWFCERLHSTTESSSLENQSVTDHSLHYELQDSSFFVRRGYIRKYFGAWFKEALNNISSLLKSEGLSRLYRGLLPPLIMRTSSRALMFGMYDELQSSLSCPHSPPNSSFTICHAQAAFLAGLCEASLCPLERVQVLLQTSAYHDQFKNTGQILGALKIYGVREYYRGLSVILARNSLSNTLFFTLKEPFKKAVMDTHPPINNSLMQLVADFMSGAILGATISTIFFPMNVVKNHIQSKVRIM